MLSTPSNSIGRVHIWSLICLFALAHFACKPKSGASATPNEVNSVAQTAPLATLPADFEAFYKQFHADSVYQMEHTVFPLEGMASEKGADEVRKRVPITFQAKDWVMHKPLDLSDSDFIQEWSFVSDGLLEETIRYRAASYGMMRRFAKMDNQWHLIYYCPMQEVGGGQAPQ
jgi:hypothetical protein